MKARVAFAAVLIAMTLSGCFEEHVCGGGEYPVKAADGGTGSACVKDGEEPPAKYERYPKGKVPEAVGDKWDTYWDQQQIEGTKALEEANALTSLRSTDEPKGWKRIDIGEIGSIAVPKGWTVEDKAGVTLLTDGKEKVEIALEREGRATIRDRVQAIREVGSETTDPILDVDISATWPGAAVARYVRTNRAVDGKDGFVSTEALLVVAKGDSLVVVQGSVAGKDIADDTVASRVLRTLLLEGGVK